MLTTKTKTLLNKVYFTEEPKEKGSIEDYLFRVDNGVFDDRFVFGVSDKEKGFLTANYFQSPNALYCGAMGSGKSQGLLFTLSTHFITNSHKTFYILYDQGKSMGDFSPLFSYTKNVITALGDEAKIVPLMDMLYSEMVKRKEIFQVWGVSGLLEYETLMDERYILYKIKQDDFSSDDIKFLVEENLIGIDSEVTRKIKMQIKETGKYDKELLQSIRGFIENNEEKLLEEQYDGLCRMVTVMEEFSLVIMSPSMNFHRNYDKYGSVAYKFENIMKLGRSFGIFFLFATQRAVADHVPTQIKPGIATMLCFKVNSLADAAGMTGVEHVTQIEDKHPGRCATKGEAFVQFPYIKKPDLINLYKKYYKPLKAELLNYQVSDYVKAFAEEGNSGMTKIKPIRELVENFTEYKVSDIVKRILTDLQYEVEVQPNRAFMAELIATKNGARSAVKVYGAERQLPEKELKNLKGYLSSLSCDNAIIIFLEDLRTMEASIEKIDKSWIGVDKTDLIQIGDVLSNKDKLESVNKYKELYPQLKLSHREDIGLLPEDDQEELDEIESEFSLADIIQEAITEPVITEKKTKTFLGRKKSIENIDS